MGNNPERRAFPSSKLVSLVERLEQEEVPAERALRGIGLTRAALMDPATRISPGQLLSAYRNAIGLTRHADFALRIGNPDAVFLERPPDRKIDVGNDIALAPFRVGDPEAEFKVDAAFSKRRLAFANRPIGHFGTNNCVLPYPNRKSK